MKPSFLVSVPVFLCALLVVLGASAMSSHALAAAANAALDKAQKDAQVKGYLFLKSHDDEDF